MSLTPGAQVGSYEIQYPLGVGGMGEVYRATDTKLSRDVALKVLPAEMANDAERLGRFRREAKVLAQLDHPNIVTIYSVEECGGVHFLTMQLVEGLPLDRMISQKGLAVELIIEIAAELADALAAAHEKGIVHRDLKPANVMVTNQGRVKVLDFGLAKDVRGSNIGDATLTSDSRTQVGVVMGTPAYMSPEQTSGRPLDHRTDIFSLGVLLHEMSTGKRPFEGNSSAELVSAILRDTPPSVTEMRPDLPSDLARIIRRCLEKDPRHRVQTALDVSNEFRDLARVATRRAPVPTSAAWATASPISRFPVREDDGFWVAVLPFKHGGSNADLSALADGLTDDIITGLSKFSYLRVIARSSSSRYAGQSVDIRAAGKELNARYVMEGTLRQAGTKIRIAVQLVDTQTGSHLWAESYERTFAREALFDLQDDLVPRVVSTVADMNGVLPQSMSQILRGRTPEQMSPYEAVLSSFGYCYSATPEALTRARAGLEEAVRKAPAYSDAWAMLSFLSGQDYVHGYELQATALEIAASAARRAVELGPSNHLAYFSLGQALWCHKDYASFRDALERAVALNPMDGNSVAYLGELLTYTGNSERGMQLVGRAKQLNPNHPGWYWFADFYHAFSQGDYRGAQSFALKAKLRGNPLAPMFLAAACGQIGDLDGSTKAVAELLKFRPELPALMRKQVAKVWNAEYGERFLEGLRKAGLEIPEADAARKSPTSSSSTMTHDSGAARADEGFWVAVLPFKFKGADASVDALAEGITEEIITGMSRFPYLHVIAHGSTLRYANQAVDLRQVGKELGARYVMEGSLRLSGSRVRIAAQLVDSTTGAQLWAETYDRTLQPEAIFELQDDVVPRIVSTVGDTQGILAQSMSEAVWNKEPHRLTPYEAVLRSFSYMRRVNAPNHAAARDALEGAVKQAPGNGLAWAMLAIIFREEYNHGFNLRSDPLGRALDAARRAVEAEPSNYLAHHALASVQFYRRELEAFRSETQRALQLNPMDGFTFGYLGMLTAFAGDWDRGCSMSAKARSVNPEYPGWYWFAPLFDAFRKQEYRLVLELAQKVNMPNFWRTNIALASTYGHLGETGPGRKALELLLAARPEFATSAKEECNKWWNPDLVDQILAGLRKAGLDAPDVGVGPSPYRGTPVRTDSGESRTAVRENEGFWIAVLPFRYAGSNDDLKALAEGLAEEVITGLSRFSYLRVIARGSTAKYSSESGDVRAIGKELGARYVMEGSLRQAGSKLRLAVQLVDAATGAHLWAETYKRAFDPESLFELQDDLVPSIVSTVADQYGVLTRSISEALRGKPEDLLTPHEAVLRSFSFFIRVTPEEHAQVRRILERTVERAPDQADCWSMLAMMCNVEYADEFNARPQPLDRALAAAQRAVTLAPTHALGHQALALVHFFRKDFVPFRAAAERAVALNPMDGSVLGLLGIVIDHAGEEDRGREMVEKAMRLNPNHPGVFRFVAFNRAYRQGRYEEALEVVVRINLPGFFHYHSSLAAVHGQLGHQEAAQKAVQDLLALRPNFAAEARRDFLKWWNPEVTEHVIDGLRKAGLEIPKEQPPVVAQNEGEM